MQNHVTDPCVVPKVHDFAGLILNSMLDLKQGADISRSLTHSKRADKHVCYFDLLL